MCAAHPLFLCPHSVLFLCGRLLGCRLLSGRRGLLGCRRGLRCCRCRCVVLLRLGHPTLNLLDARGIAGVVAQELGRLRG